MRRAVIFGVPLLALAAVVLLHFTADDIAHGLPGCIILKTTGFYCPGCGATRAVLALLRGRFLTAIKYNMGLCTLGIICVAVYLEYVSNKKILPRNGYFWAVFGIVLFLYYFMRNFVILF